MKQYPSLEFNFPKTAPASLKDFSQNHYVLGLGTSYGLRSALFKGIHIVGASFSSP
jgi:hypothetical protein